MEKDEKHPGIDISAYELPEPVALEAVRVAKNQRTDMNDILGSHCRIGLFVDSMLQ